VNEKLLTALVEHGPLVAAAALIYWKLTPRLLKATLQNGGGDIVRGIVRAENAAQSKSTHEAIEKSLADHEAREWRQYGSLGEQLASVRERLAGVEGRISDHLAPRASA
jgi:hypothetical protein